MNKEKMPDQTYLLSPIEEDDFFTNYFEKKSLHISRDNSVYFDQTLSLEDIDALIASGRLYYPMINMIKKGGQKAVASWIGNIDPDPKLPINKEKLFQQIADGHTLTINSTHHFIPKLHKYLIELGAKWGVTFAANTYITPANSQGFDWHYDHHDVFIQQISGTKKWELEKGAPFLPDANYKPISPKKNNIGETKTILLEAGDTLYIPRGMYHKAITESESSVHLTIGFSATKVYEIFENLLQKAYAQKEFRQSILSKEIKPFDYKSAMNLAERFVLDYFEKEENNTAINKLSVEHKVESKVANDYSRLSSILKIDSLKPDTPIQLNSISTPKFLHQGEFIILTAGNKEWKYPKFMEETLISILSKQPISIRNIIGSLPDKHKLELVKKFIIKGLIKVVKTA